MYGKREILIPVAKTVLFLYLSHDKFWKFQCLLYYGDPKKRDYTLGIPNENVDKSEHPLCAINRNISIKNNLNLFSTDSNKSKKVKLQWIDELQLMYMHKTMRYTSFNFFLKKKKNYLTSYVMKWTSFLHVIN